MHVDVDVNCACACVYTVCVHVDVNCAGVYIVCVHVDVNCACVYTLCVHVDEDNPWIVLRKAWINTLRGQSLDCPGGMCQPQDVARACVNRGLQFMDRPPQSTDPRFERGSVHMSFIWP